MASKKPQKKKAAAEKPEKKVELFPATDAWTLERVMAWNPAIARESDTVAHVCSLMADRHTGQVCIIPDDWEGTTGELPPEPFGIFTERDLVRALVAHQEKLPSLKIGSVMTAPVMCLETDDELQHAFNMMILLRIRRIPVLRKGRLVGIVTRGRLMEAQRQRIVEVEEENEELESQLVHDPLTGLANRVLFQQVIEREIGRFERHGGYLGLLMIDIDFFKRVNDTHGHLVGDVVLRQISSVLREEVRRADLLARIGGEEFAVIVSQKRKPDLKKLGEKLRERIASQTYGEDPDRFPVTISVGAKLYSKDMGGRSGLMKQADKNLYEAKQTGRNKVVGP